jgi:cell division protein FtsW
MQIQVFINVGVVIGLLPVTGITLPIISYGGSSLILSMMMIAIVLNISKYQEG